MRGKHFLYAFIGFLIVILFFGALIKISIRERNGGEYTVKGEVINLTYKNITKIGISTDPYWLNFGRMVVNKTNITKIIDIKNPLPYSIVVKIVSKGNASPFLIFPNKVLIKPKEKKSIYVKFYARKVGNFTGNLSVKVLYPINRLGEWVLVKEYEKNIIR